MSLEDSLLLSLLYQGTASFERHRRSVQARVPLREANRVKAARRQRGQASRAAFGMCVLSGTREERTSSGFGVSGCEFHGLGDGIVKGGGGIWDSTVRPWCR